ncbi:MAG: HAMP domain-containing sensor histidine kinase [Bacteroidota bacterium]
MTPASAQNNNTKDLYSDAMKILLRKKSSNNAGHSTGILFALILAAITCFAAVEGNEIDAIAEIVYADAAATALPVGPAEHGHKAITSAGVSLHSLPDYFNLPNGLTFLIPLFQACAILLFIQFRKKQHIGGTDDSLAWDNQVKIAAYVLEQSRTENKRLTAIVNSENRKPLSNLTETLHTLIIKKSGKANEAGHTARVSGTGAEAAEFKNEIAQLNDVEPAYRFVLTEINEVLQNSADLTRQTATEAGIFINVCADHCKAEIDAGQITKVLCKIINNAVKHSPANSAIFLRTICLSNKVLIIIRDQGVGFDNKQRFTLSNILSGSNSASQGHKNSGLGMCSQIIQQHGGRIWFDSEAGKGASFFVELPVKP